MSKKKKFEPRDGEMFGGGFINIARTVNEDGKPGHLVPNPMKVPFERQSLIETSQERDRLASENPSLIFETWGRV